MKREINKNILTILLLLGASSLSAWEVNTHQALTRCAITDECKEDGTQRASNLQFLVENNDISKKSYYKEKYPEFPSYTYISYARSGEEAFYEDWLIDSSQHHGNYIDMIETGSILEDALYSNADWIAQGGDGRFNNHFYDPQKEKKKLTMGYGFNNVDAVTWAIDGATVGSVLDKNTNEYSYKKTLNYYKDSFTQKSSSERATNQARMFISLGHLLHLLQDMHVPAHVRDDAHSEYDLFEYWARNENGFMLRNGRFINENKTVKNAVKKLNIRDFTKRSQFTDARSFYVKEATFTSNNFLSFGKDAVVADIGVVFDKIHRPKKDEDTVKILYKEEKNYIGAVIQSKYYYNSLKNTVNDIISATVNPKKIAMQTNSIFSGIGDIVIKERDDNSILIDNALNLIPRAVGASEGFINYFFRGRMEAKLESKTLTITNISDTSLVASADIVTFKKNNGAFSVYYDTNSGERKLLDTICSFDNDIARGESIICEINNIKDLTKYEQETISVVFDGTIGTKRSISVTKLKKIDFPLELENIGQWTHTVVLQWNKNDDATGYTVCKSEKRITDGAKCEENGGILLYPLASDIVEITEGGEKYNRWVVEDGLEGGKDYYFRVNQNGKKLWSNEIGFSTKGAITFLLPQGATTSDYQIFAKEGDTISFYSSSFTALINRTETKGGNANYVLYCGLPAPLPLSFDAETNIFSFKMPSSSIYPKKIQNIYGSTDFNNFWVNKTVELSTVTLNLGTDITLEEEKESNPIPFTISDKDNKIKTIECSTTPIGITISNTNENVTVTAPKYSDMQSFTVKCVASDDNNELASDEVEVTVTKKPVVTPTVFLDLGSDDSKQEETSITYPISTSGDVDKIETISCSTTPSISVFENNNTGIKLTIPKYNAISNNLFTIQCDAKDSTEKVLATDSKKITITQKSINTPPTANAGADQTIQEGESVTLDGSGSSDADGDTLTYYKWVDDVSKDEKIGKMVTFDNLSVGEHNIRLMVSDGKDIGSDEVKITVTKVTSIVSTIKKTGQTIAYTKYDDGFYEKGIIPNYTEEQDKILDRTIGLLWQNNSHTTVNNKVSWSEAKAYCAQLIEGLRLPTRQELSGLVRYDKYNPSIDDIFDYTTADYYWTEDVSLRDENKVWAVSFNEGTEATVAKTGSYPVRCVKKLSLAVANAGADQMAREKESVTLDGSHSPNREDIVSYKWSEGATALGEGEKFSISTLPDGVHKITLTVKDKDGKTDSDEVVITVTSEKDILKKTSQNISYAKFDDGFYEKGVALNYAKSGDNILDKSTGLIWQDSDSGKKLWKEAEGYCASLDGHWRLPTRRELSNLVSYNRYSPSIDDIFSSTTSDYYWTIDTNKRDHDKAWAISFSEGVESALAKSSSYYVRCVQNNLEPIANAGVDQLVVEGQPVVLRATESSRRELIKSYVWLEGDKELGQGAVFEPENMIDGEHQITLVVKDESGNELSRDSLRVTIISDNRVLKQTGQNISYAKFDDGYYEKGIALNYTKRDDDILDRTTGLLWQDTQESKENTNSWQDAKEYCNLLDGHWRLPTRKELSNLVRYNRYNPSIDDIFSFTTSDYYWTIDTSIRDRDKAWAISFSEGVESTVAKSSSYYARCVQSDFVPTANAGADILITKGTPTLLDAGNSPRKNLIDSYLWENSGGEVGDKERSPIDTSFSGREKITLTITDKEGRTDIDDLWLTIVANNKIVKKTGQTESYADYDDGDYQKGVSLSYSDHGDSVTDNATELEWKDDESTNSVKMTWKEANEYCSRDDSNWRLPTRHELSSLIDYSAYNPSINSSFDNTASDYYWSVDTSMRDNDKAWAVSFSEGVESTLDKSGSYYVRCVNTN